jgi:mono/diheme cytochrome c family protein
MEAARTIYIDAGCDLCHGVAGEGDPDGPDLYDLNAQELYDYTRDPPRDPDSKWQPMDRYPLEDLSHEELTEIVYYLLHIAPR